MPQNLLDIGIDLVKLEADKQAALKIVQSLFNEMKKYETSKISPINVGGLGALTSQTKQQAEQLQKIQSEFAQLNVTMKQYVAMMEKMATTEAKLTLATTEEAKALAVKTLELEKANKANKAYALSLDAEHQAKLKQAAIDKQLAADKKKADKDARDAKAQQIKDDRELRREQEKNNKQKQKDDKAAIRDSDLYLKLTEKRNDLEKRYANAVLNKSPQSVQKGLASELQLVNQQIKEVDKSLEKAGSNGADKLGRGLNSVFGSIRQIAYILPGLGIAGIFNIAFEILGKLVEELGLFNDKFDKSIELQIKFNELLEKEKQLLSDSADFWKLRSEEGLDYYNRIIDITQAGGANFEQLMSLTDQMNEARRRAAKEYLDDLQIQDKEEVNLNTNLMNLLDKRDKLLRGIGATEEEIRNTKVGIESPIAGIPGVGTFVGAYELLAKAGQKSGLKDLSEDLTKQLEVFEKSYKDQYTRLNTIIDARKSLSQADAKIEATNAANRKYFSDEERKRILDDSEYKLNLFKDNNQRILDNETATENERLIALENIGKAEKALAQAKYDDAMTTIGRTSTDELKALNDYNEAVLKTEKETTEKQTKIITDFYFKKLEMTHKTTQTEITMEQLKDKTLADNEQAAYDERLDAFMEYLLDREKIEYNQLQKDLAEAKRLPKDLQELKAIELMTEYKKKIADIYNGARKEAYAIVQSWYKKEDDLIKSHADEQQSIVQDAATEELTELNKSFKDKEISYRKFSKTRLHIEYETQMKINDAKIADDKAEIKKLEDLQQELAVKYGQAETARGNAVTEGEKEIAKGKLDSLFELIVAGQKKIKDKRNELSKDELKAASDFNKQTEDAIKQRNENYIQLEQELVDGIQSIVDAGFDRRLEQLTELTEAQNAAADAEIEAIERSTLAASDKNAYEIQLNAQKEARDKKLAQEEKKIRHDQAVFNKEVAAAEIIANTAVAITGALKIPVVGVGLAFSHAALGATQLAILLATKIPSYAYGGEHPGGLARFGEAGDEIVKEPGKQPYVAKKETISYLPKGTELIPMYKVPTVTTETKNDSWEQTIYLGKMIQKSKKEIKNVFRPNIIVDLNTENYKRRILNR